MSMPPNKKFKMNAPVADPSPVDSRNAFKLDSIPDHHYHLGNHVFVVVSEFFDSVKIHIRKYIQEMDYMKPTKDGTTLSPLTWQEPPDSMCIKSFHYYANRRRVSLLNDELFIVAARNQEKEEIVLQKLFVKKDLSRQFMPNVISIDELQFNTLESYEKEITKSVFTKMFQVLFRRKAFTVFSKIKCQQPLPTTDCSVGKKFLTSTIEDLLFAKLKRLYLNF
ncbi:hypothetical protein JTE90_019734 [Oedothorax gibbosus]|uniref:Transcriptional coactivator p15 (PC4) C-terminal domain-containing protein n=1 Tax=Oedothorax gibbosus TaxID=931172 RepID=A0AAV6UQA7_9ARAC|nr:hypothetical protein JTE90_019734 [Oedothorax gibbosus]